MTSQPGSRVRAQGFADAARAARATSIRYATVFGSVLAFALLCIVSARADTLVGVNPNARALSPDAGHADIAGYGLLAALALLSVLTAFAFGGWCRAGARTRRAVKTARDTEDTWQRRYAAVEAQEQATRALAAAQVAAAATQERERVQVAMRHFIRGPLSALAALLATLNGSSLPTAHRPLAGRIQSALHTCVRALEDMLASSPVESRPIILDESLTDLREVIDGVVALFSSAAAQKGVHLRVSIDPSIAARVLADGSRVGQMVFYLVSRAVCATEHGQVAIVAWAEPLNAGSQRIFISVREGGDAVVCPARPIQAQLSRPCEHRLAVGTIYDETATDLALCQRLAQHMRGELTIRSESGCGACSTFSASFAVEPACAPMVSARAGNSSPRPAVTPARSFDQSYLDALSSEGVDLHVFLRGWQQSIRDDLIQMQRMCDLDDVSGLRASLHRLSGAVGMVGARSLMEALQLASVAQPEPEAGAIDVLPKRIEALMRDVDEAIDMDRSNLS
ncbi:Hpt domain-containing protein [Paraburkholderia sp. BCC1885]|uniref:Hpt domain-containing protein n=1 Tax=Paraburkholderia sp. BCC1885 TaxID=2562669 RepID=UPI0016431A6F|nr:Hpt domain-containing protein [Paraburkholderia sp. BCC1885]